MTFPPQGDILEDDEDYLVDELSQPVLSDGEMGGDSLSEAPSPTAAVPASKSPALSKKQQHPTYKGSLALSFSKEPRASNPLSLSARALHEATVMCSQPTPGLKPQVLASGWKPGSGPMSSYTTLTFSSAFYLLFFFNRWYRCSTPDPW